jgi:hypothetical protein
MAVHLYSPQVFASLSRALVIQLTIRMHAHVSLSREVQVTVNPVRVWNNIMLMPGRVGLGAAKTVYFLASI